MALEFSSIPLAALAGALSILSPCVWPLVPAVMSSAATGGRTGPWFLAAGLSLSFAVAGTVLAFVLLNLGLDQEIIRTVAAVMLLFMAAVLMIKPLGDWVTLKLASFSARFGGLGQGEASTAAGQFTVGALLGLVWLPCIGPTLGAAVALASLGQSMAMAFTVMLAFGLGCSAVLLAAGLFSAKVLNRWRPGVLTNANRGKKLLGVVLAILGIMVLTGVDKILETWALQVLPDWAISI
ncbi:MAG: cytochrome c biogenesis CcdA family protein [Pseudomonadota bacterium]